MTKRDEYTETMLQLALDRGDQGMATAEANNPPMGELMFNEAVTVKKGRLYITSHGRALAKGWGLVRQVQADTPLPRAGKIPAGNVVTILEEDAELAWSLLQGLADRLVGPWEKGCDEKGCDDERTLVRAFLFRMKRGEVRVEPCHFGSKTAARKAREWTWSVPIISDAKTHVQYGYVSTCREAQAKADALLLQRGKILVGAP
jgi:hypothetical protein